MGRPTEQTWTYERLGAPFETDLYKYLHSRFGDLQGLEKLFHFSKEASSTMGKWCSDWVWSYGLGEDVLPKLEGQSEKRLMRNEDLLSPNRTETEVKRIHDARAVIVKHDFGNPNDSPDHLSSKVRLLHHELSRYFERHTDTKCIVFTNQRHTARILKDLFSRIGTQYLRPGLLIGVRSSDPGCMNVSCRQQIMTLMKFRNGKVNCLVGSAGKFNLVCTD